MRMLSCLFRRKKKNIVKKEIFFSPEESEYNLSWGKFNKNHEERISELKQKIQNVAFLNLSFNHLNDEIIVSLANTLKNAHSLKILNLNANQIGDRGARALAHLLPFIPLQTLMLVDNQIGDRGAEALAKALPDSSLKRLSLLKNRISLIGTNLLQRAAAQKESSLEVLDVSPLWNKTSVKLPFGVNTCLWKIQRWDNPFVFTDENTENQPSSGNRTTSTSHLAP